jgi:preprotein translocase subunit SecG
MLKYYDIIFIIVSLIVIVLSLLQGGKSEGASGAITGGGLNVFAKTKERGSEKVVSWLTFGFAVLFLFLALLIMIINVTQAASSSASGAASSGQASVAAIGLFLR